jgi:hypothetical protein
LKEQENHKKAFEFYYGMGEGRNYRKVAEEFGVSIGAVVVAGIKLDIVAGIKLDTSVGMGRMRPG